MESRFFTSAMGRITSVLHKQSHTGHRAVDLIQSGVHLAIQLLGYPTQLGFQLGDDVTITSANARTSTFRLQFSNVTFFNFDIMAVNTSHVRAQCICPSEIAPTFPGKQASMHQLPLTRGSPASVWSREHLSISVSTSPILRIVSFEALWARISHVTLKISSSVFCST